MNTTSNDPKGVAGNVYVSIHTSYGWPSLADLEIDIAVSSLPGDRKPHGEDGLFFRGSSAGYIRMRHTGLYMYEPSIAVDRECGSMHLIGNTGSDFDCAHFADFAKSDPAVQAAVSEWTSYFGSWYVGEAYTVVLDALRCSLANYLL